MFADTVSSDALGVSSTPHHAAVDEAEALSATAMARRDLVTKISTVDGCSEAQAEVEISSFEKAFQAL